MTPIQDDHQEQGAKNTADHSPIVPDRSRSLLDDLCGSRVEVSDQEATEPHLSVPPTGIADQGGDNIVGPCWVARAVYGVENPRWIEFRAWLLGDAPEWFRRVYIRHGERFARCITPMPRVKAAIRRWMDSVIAR